MPRALVISVAKGRHISPGVLVQTAVKRTLVLLKGTIDDTQKLGNTANVSWLELAKTSMPWHVSAADKRAREALGYFVCYAFSETTNFTKGYAEVASTHTGKAPRQRGYGSCLGSWRRCGVILEQHVVVKIHVVCDSRAFNC